jgi:hypothetical protein
VFDLAPCGLDDPRAHPLNLHIDADVPVRVDPRLTATAIAHVLENAAQYFPAGTGIERQPVNIL